MGGYLTDCNPLGRRAPTLKQMTADHLEPEGPTTELLEAAIEDDAANNMY